MKQIMIAIVILLATLTNSFAGNSVWILQQNQDSDGSIFIKQDGNNNKVGVSTSQPFIIDGNNVTVIIKQIGNYNVTDSNSHLSFKGEDMTMKVDITGDTNSFLSDIDDADATGHYYDLKVVGNQNILDFDAWAADDVSKTNIDLDIVGDSNTFWVRSRGDGHFLYVLISGDSNNVQFYSPESSAGFNTNSNIAIGPQVESHGQFADTSGSEGATLDLYMVGNSNELATSSYGTGNYQVHDIIGSSNILGLHPSHENDSTDPYGSALIISGNNNYLKTVVNGNDNELRLHQSGGRNTARIYIYTSNSDINMAQTGGANTADINVSGDSIYDYTLNFTQNGSDTCNYSYNRNNQTADVTATVANGC